MVWKYKHDNKLSLKDEIKMKVDEKLAPFNDDLINMHHLI